MPDDRNISAEQSTYHRRETMKTIISIALLAALSGCAMTAEDWAYAIAAGSGQNNPYASPQPIHATTGYGRMDIRQGDQKMWCTTGWGRTSCRPY